MFDKRYNDIFMSHMPHDKWLLDVWVYSSEKLIFSSFLSSTHCIICCIRYHFIISLRQSLVWHIVFETESYLAIFIINQIFKSQKVSN